MAFIKKIFYRIISVFIKEQPILNVPNQGWHESWTPALTALIQDKFEILKSAKDITTIRPDFNSLSKENQIKVLVEFIKALCYFESGYNSESSSVDVGIKGNKDTYSVGLMQMSVVDQQNYGLRFGYTFDDLLKAVPNLTLGIAILAKQVQKYGKILIQLGEKGVYWAVLHPGGKYDRSVSIIKRVQELKFDETPKAEKPVQTETGLNLAWYPKAVKGTGMKTLGKYECDYPRGAIVHYTAGHCDTEEHAKDSLNWGKGEGYAFFLIGPTGVVYQNFPLTHWGSHAGSSFWVGLGSSVSKHCVGIEIACAGLVESNGKSWFGKTYSKDRLRKVPKLDNVKAGTYVKYTDKQEESLIDLLCWLHKNNPSVFEIKYILGHDEVAPDRKQDPGGSLSMTMPHLRSLIAEKVKN